MASREELLALLAQERKRAERAEARAARAEDVLQTSPPVLIDRGLPPLPPRHGSVSNATMQKTHPPVDAHLNQPFGVFSAGDLKMRARTGIEMPTMWSTEADIQGIVTNVLLVIIDMLSLKGHVVVTRELTVFALRPDLWVVTLGGVPIGFIEVKTPSSDDVIDDPMLSACVYDYLKCLRTFSGLRHVFGVATTYTHWRVYWLDTEASHRIAAESKRAAPDESPPPIEPQPSFDPADEADEEGSDVGNTEPEPASARVVYGSRVYRVDDDGELLVRLIATLVLKMVHCASLGRDPVAAFVPGRTYLCVDEQQWYWASVSWGRRRKLTHCKPPRTNQFILFAELGTGADGHVWHACTSSGIAFVLKFQRRLMDTHVLAIEAKAWNLANRDAAPFLARVARVAGAEAILMPYMHRCVDLAANELAVVRALERSAANGVLNRDLDPRHLGVFSPVKDGKLGVMDLGRCEFFNPDDPEKRASALDDMRRALFHD